MALTVFQIRRDVISALRRRSPQIHSDFERQVAGVRANPHLHFAKPSVETFVAYLQGYDEALHGVPLEGFFYWLELTWNPDGNPRHWINGLQVVAQRQARPSKSRLRVLDAACAITQRFFTYRRRYGTAKLAKKYMERPRGRQLALRALQTEVDAVAASNKSLERTRER